MATLQNKRIFNCVLYCLFVIFFSFSSSVFSTEEKYDSLCKPYTVSNPFVLLTGASKYIPTEEEEKLGKDISLRKVKDEMNIFRELFVNKCGYEMRSTFFDTTGDIFSDHKGKSIEEMDGEFLYKERFKLWIDSQHRFLFDNSEKYDALFFIFSGHGTSFNGVDYIVTSDRGVLNWEEDIEKRFAFPHYQIHKDWAAKCPKFFFKLSCRGGAAPNIVRFKGGGTSRNLAAQTYTFYSTSRGNPTSDNSGLYLAKAIYKVISGAVKDNKSLCWVDSRLKEEMSQCKYNVNVGSWQLSDIVDSPICYSGLVGDKIFFARKYSWLEIDAVVSKLKENSNHYYKGWNELHIIAYNGDVEAIRAFIGSSFDSVKEVVRNDNDVYDGFNALNISAIRGHKDCVEVFVKCFPKLVKEVVRNGGVYNGFNVLHLAACFGKKSIVEILIKYFPKLIKKVVERNNSFSGHNVLHIAVRNGVKDIVEFLVKHFPKLSKDVIQYSNSFSGYNAFYLAACFGCVEVCEVLLKYNPELLKEVGRPAKV